MQRSVLFSKKDSIVGCALYTHPGHTVVGDINVLSLSKAVHITRHIADSCDVYYSAKVIGDKCLIRLVHIHITGDIVIISVKVEGKSV